MGKVFIIDDASSMTARWKQVRDVLEILSYILKVDANGVDVYFTNSDEHLNAKSTTKILRVFDQHDPHVRSHLKLSTNVNESLGNILQRHMTRMRSWPKAKAGLKLGSSKVPQPVTFYVLTDGIWRGNSDMDSCLKALETVLTDLERDDSQSGLQFISFGNDPAGKERLAQMHAELLM